MERRGLWKGGVVLFLLSVFRIGFDRLDHGPGRLPTSDSEVEALLAASREKAEDEARRSAPLAPGESLDPNRSGEEDLDRLPGIGPVTARAMVSSREEYGGFETPRDLLRVPGIGPAKLEKIARYLDFSQGVPLGLQKPQGKGRSREVPTPTSRVATPVGSDKEAPAPAQGVDLNRATADELESLPGIGPALARRIVQDREAFGRFLDPADLLRVPGIGPAILARVRGLVTTGGEFLDPLLH